MKYVLKKLYCEKKLKFNSEGRRMMVKKIVLVIVIALVMGVSNLYAGATIFSDDFSTYNDGSGYPVTLNVAGADKWYVPREDGGTYHIGAGGWYGDRACVANSYWGENADLSAYAKISSAVSDCTVSADALASPGYESAAQYYIVARATETSFIKLSVMDGGQEEEDGPRALYARITDSDGGSTGDLYLGEWTTASAISMILNVNGSAVTATITNGSLTYNITDYATTVLDAGTAGFGSVSQWNYAIALFDNFTISEIPEPATMILMSIGLAVVRFRKK
jgi:hypothetical protein